MSAMSSRRLLVLVAVVAVFAAGVVVGRGSSRAPRRTPECVAPPDVLIVSEPLADGTRRFTTLRAVQARYPGDANSDSIVHVGRQPSATAWAIRVGDTSYFGEVESVHVTVPPP
jgi:hypothetical protein